MKLNELAFELNLLEEFHLTQTGRDFPEIDNAYSGHPKMCKSGTRIKMPLIEL